MNEQERKEVEALPDKYHPMGSWAYFGYSLLFSLGIVGFICAIVFACSNENIARRNFARSFIIAWVFGIILAVVLCVIVVMILSSVDWYPPEYTYQCVLNLL